MHIRITPVMILCSFIALLSYATTHAASPPSYIWLEGEQSHACNIDPTLNGWGNTHYLSGDNWLSFAFDKNAVKDTISDDGVTLDYRFNADKAANYELWARVGFEFVRSPFEWRIDDGQWTESTPDELTTDLMEIAEWCEIAWLDLGDVNLAQGEHTLQFRFLRHQNDKGEYQNIRFALDAICMTAGPFHPNSKYKPDESGLTSADLEASKHKFYIPSHENEYEPNVQRETVTLDGTWQICRDDEQLPGAVDEPIAELPQNPVWTAIQVPGDKNTLRPDLKFAHRVWYRTCINIPKMSYPHGFFIEFPQNNLNTTVYVNGQLCGFNKNPFAKFSIDISKAVREGDNEIMVGIRDAWYAYSTNPNDPMKLRRKFNLPIKFFSAGFQDLAYPIWNHPQSGILATPRITATLGPVYVADVFCKPHVGEANDRSDDRLDAEITLRNITRKEQSGRLLCAAILEDETTASKGFEEIPYSLKPDETKTLHFSQPWPDAKYWWPDEPNLYRFDVGIAADGFEPRLADRSCTTFGFRQWSIDGRNFKLNGLKWHGWADCFRADTPDAWLDFYRQSNQRVMRFWGTSWKGLPPEEALEFFDRNGVVCRRSGMLDGQRIGNMAMEKDPELQKLYDSEIKIQLLRNWEDQMVAQVRGERNHPSVMIWSLENEFLYINCINLHRSHMDEFEREVTRVSDAVQQVDPTRPTMVDGGGATLANTLPVHGDHYVFKGYTNYPDLAYQPNVTGGGRERWQWDQQRPRFIGEDYFANGINPFDFSYFGGEETFQGKAATRRAAGIIYRMLTEGYRWADYGAWHFWMGQNEAIDQYNSNAPRAVFCKEYDWTFASGETINRTLRIFNDTRFDDPITLNCQLQKNSLPVSSNQHAFTIAPGENVEYPIQLTMPETESRDELELLLTLTVNDEEVFRAVKPVSLLGPITPLARKQEAALIVYDPSGNATSFLKKQDIAFTSCNTLPDDLIATYPNARVLLIGNDALSSTECDSSRFQAFATGGRSVIILEQHYPLRYQALPADMQTETNEGRTAFIENPEHPIFTGLRQKDFFTWSGGDHIVYRDAYEKPRRGGTSLVQCDTRLHCSAMTEMPCGEGLLLTSQLLIGEKLAQSVVARHLLANMLRYASEYEQVFSPVAVCTRDLDPQFAEAIDSIRLQYSETSDPVSAIGDSAIDTVILSATPSNLQMLIDNKSSLQQFYDRGGQLFIHGLTPEALAQYNHLVGFEHMIRPFTRERVTLPAKRNPLTSGLTTGDVVMLSGERIFGWTKDEFVASDVFTYIVDFDDVAPFARFPDEFSRNMVNGMVSSDAWKYIVNIPAPNQPPLDWQLQFPKPQTLTEMTWTGNTFYWPVTCVELFFDGNAAKAARFTTEPTTDPQTFAIEPPINGTELTLRLAEWQILPDKRQVTGLDNIALKAARSDDFYRRVRPLLNIGGMMEYDCGNGRIVMCNLKFQATETVPENMKKKHTILAALLRNMKAPFAEGKTVIAGMKMQYTPIDITGKCTQYRGPLGWFGDKNLTFNHMPTGLQRLAGVPFTINDFPTSPVPDVIMLKGRRTPGDLPDAVNDIAIHQKADALFFLQTAQIERRRSPRDISDGKQYEMLRYVVHYADGQTVDIPILSEIDIDHWRQAEPQTIPGAQLAWVGPYEQSEESAVAYKKQWNNPRPDVEITSIDMKYGAEPRGVPVLIAVTAATVE